jgi:hypothetical protein
MRHHGGESRWIVTWMTKIELKSNNNVEKLYILIFKNMYNIYQSWKNKTHFICSIIKI